MTLGPIWHYAESSCVNFLCSAPPMDSLPLGPVLYLPLGPSDMDDVQPVQVLHLAQTDKVPTSATGLTDRVAGGHRPCPLYLQPTPCQVQLHGFQLFLGVTSLALRLLQVAGISLKSVECAYSILATTVPR